jgi:CubicO group peptidase (beta-lactamase class C family)
MCCTTALFAQTLSDKVDVYVQKAMIEQHIPGISLAIVLDGVIVKVKGYGLSDVENKIPVTPETIFQSGSLGKQFTAAAILQLKEEGKLKLDDKIATYFAKAPATWQNITIRNLLTHTSGVAAIPYDETGINPQINYSEEELLNIAMKLPLDFETGEKWAYSDTGYMLLGILIHQITGEFYGQLLQEKIFSPLSMETAKIISETELVMNRSSGYELKNGEWKNQTWVAPSLNTTADGSLHFSVLDLIKWDASITKEKILNQEDLQAMVTPVKLNNGSFHPYGFAWFLNPINGHKAFLHGGSWQGFNNYIARFPDDKLTVIVLTNLKPSSPGLIAKDIAAIYVPELSRRKATFIKDDNVTMANLITTLFKDPTGADLNNPLFSKEALPKIKALTFSNDSLLKKFGQVESVARVESVANSNQSTYLIKYKVGSRLVSVTMNNSGKIANVVSESY